MQTHTEQEARPHQEALSSLPRTSLQSFNPATSDYSLPSLYRLNGRGNQPLVPHEAGIESQACRAARSSSSHDLGKIAAMSGDRAISTAGDDLEQEADCVSQQVMRISEPRSRNICACGGACRSCPTKQAAGHGQPVKSTNQAPVHGLQQVAWPPTVYEALSSPRRSLDAATRSFMETRFGHDFSRVRIHHDEKAARSARAVHAHAYTVGQSIVFGKGQYAPASIAGKRLLAHELTHVLQQEQGSERNRIQCNSWEYREGAPLRGEGSAEGGETRGDLSIAAGVLLCGFAPDSWVVDIARGYFEWRWPRAYTYLAYYLGGRGGVISVDVATLLEENPQAADRVAGIIREAATESGTYVGADPVTAPIRQQDYSDENWRMALGNIDEVSWQILDQPDSEGYALVRVRVRDRYHWSPEDERVTDCIHEVMERQKEHGAAEFMADGEGDVRLRIVDPTPGGP